ncbi:hypothetical protein ANABIO32_22500 [Rossellomorea marisflavi]|uniref:hypothetical protein n=2 Tax=Bacillaceae TaxID=186817 RepID=UPI0012F08639|nr:hypothetical protein [Rossellomorea marisflavi]MCM2591103.1 hypothetical protein [Rossellomorea marisflavi]GLI84542.1 hypothetical protein ANABIO32_22500 [Rossellomorea marisflavi]VXC54741.1 conserved hypothetical protein [Bacillus sp. 349Y]
MTMWKNKRIKVELPPEQYAKAQQYLERLKEADNLVELNYYYKKVAQILGKSQNV